NTIASAPRSSRCADHGSPVQMPRNNDTAYENGSARDTNRSAGGKASIGKNKPDSTIIGYSTSAPIGCAKRAVGTTLAIRKPIVRMLTVTISNASAKLANGG